MKRRIALAVLLLAMAAWYVPQISAARYREPIRQALEKALGRGVKVGMVQFRLLPLPGFTVQDVLIGEDPSIGAEPIAYVTTLRARPRLSALLAGRLQFDSVDLEETSLNLTRVDSGPGGVRWNFASLMNPKLLAAFPSIHMSGGRINFKFGDTKSIFYLFHTDVDLWPPSRADDPWTLRLRAEPARTDRPARGFGSFSARGQWIQRDGTVIVDVKFEKSELGDMLTLVQGRESGVHGHIWGDAHLGGPLSHVGLTGRVTVDDIHGWNQPPPPGAVSWPLAVGGLIDVPGQTVDLRATAGGKQTPVDVRYRVSGYLGRPRWGILALFTGMPISPVLGLARGMGLSVPPDLTLDGSADGAVGYSMPGGIPSLDGQVRIADSTVQVAGSPPLRIAGAQIRFSGSSVTLSPATIANSADETATLQGSYDTDSKRLSVSLATEEMSIPSLRRQIALSGAPLLGLATSGAWSGSLQWDGGWTGQFHLKNADVPFEAFATPVHVISADASIGESGIDVKRLSVSVGGIAAQGEYAYQNGAPRPHRFKLSVNKADGAVLEKLLTPTLHRGNFFNYAFNFGRVPEPGWLRAMHAEGTLQTASLALGPRHLTKIRTRVLWDGDQVKLTALQARMEDADFVGDTAIDLAQRQPGYRIAGRISGVNWRSGTIQADGVLKTSGTGLELLTNMTAQGAFKAWKIDLTPLDTWDTAAGRFDWAWNVRNPRLKLTDLVMATGGDTYTGTAETQDNGQLVLRISDGTKRIQAAGALLKGDDLKPTAQ